MNQKKAGVVLSYFSEAVKIVSALFYTPIMLRIVGDGEYGLYQLIQSTVAYLGLLSLGFGSSYIRFYSRAKTSVEDPDGAKVNGMYLLVFLFISLISVICGCIMTLNLESVFSSGLTPAEYSKARILFLVLVVNVALTFPNSLFNCIISAHEQFFFQRLLRVLHEILNPFLALPLLLLGYGSIGMVCVTTFLTFATLLSNIVFCYKKIHPKFCFNGIQWSILKEITGFTFFIFLNQVIDQVNWNVDKFLLGRYLGTSAVAVYGLGAQINTLYVQMSTAVSSVFVPQINRMVATKKSDSEVSKVFIKVGRMQFFILSLILCGFMFLGKPFMILWGGSEKFDISYYITLLLIVPVTVPLIQNVGIEVQRAQNKHRVRSIVYFVIAIANVCISIPLIRSLGVIGAPIGTAISVVGGNALFINWYYHKKIGLDIPLFWKSIGSILPALIIPVMIGVIIMLFVPIHSFLQVLLWAVVYGMIHITCLWLFALNQNEKKIAMDILHKMKKNSIEN